MQQEKYARLSFMGLALVLAALALWLVGRVLLLLFGAVLLAVFLRSLAEALGNRFCVPQPLRLAIVIILLCGAAGAAFHFLAPQVAHQSEALWKSTGATAERLQETVSRYLPDLKLPQGGLPSASQLTRGLFGLTNSAIDLLTMAGLILFVGIYLAADPRTYVAGILRLIGPDRRSRVEATLAESARVLRWWLLGRAIAMASVGVLVILGLSAAGVKLAVALGLLTGVLTFVPYVGAILSAVPALLVASAQGTPTLVYTAAVFVAAHILEGYVIVPLVQQRVIHMPPALLLSAQAILGTLFGLLGVAFAAPLTAIGMVTIDRLYLKRPDGYGDGDGTGRAPEIPTEEPRYDA